MNEIKVGVATADDIKFVQQILQTIEESAKVRGTGIAKREPQYIIDKINQGKAIIASSNDMFVGFCYIESWGNKKFVANSGLIVRPEYRGHGVAKDIKRAAFALSRQLFPDAKIFGLTTALAVMKINSELGYKPVTFSELTNDDSFWKGCQSCVNYDILTRTERKHCLCTGMLYDPVWEKQGVHETKEPETLQHPLPVYDRWMRFKQFVLMRLLNKRNGGGANVLTEKKKLFRFF
jgi:GNAT superfamily N-acetyltransferase